MRPGCATLAVGGILILAGIGFLFPEIRAAVAPSMPTSTSVVPISMTASPAPVSSSAAEVSGSEQVYSNSTVLHLGDQEYPEWQPLLGNCYKMSFVIRRPVNRLVIRLQAFDTDAENPVSLNGVQVALLPAQNEAYAGSWSDTFTVPVSSTQIQQGTNDITICSAPALNPDFEGDKDDFQIRDVSITTE